MNSDFIIFLCFAAMQLAKQAHQMLQMVSDRLYLGCFDVVFPIELWLSDRMDTIFALPVSLVLMFGLSVFAFIIGLFCYYHSKEVGLKC